MTSCSGGKRSIQAELRAQTRNAPPKEATRRGRNLMGWGPGVHKVYRALLSHASLEEPLKKVSLDMPLFLVPGIRASYTGTGSPADAGSGR